MRLNHLADAILTVALSLSSIGTLAQPITPSASNASTPSHSTRPPAYRVENDHGVSWFVSPSGKRMFSVGVDCVDSGAEPADYKLDQPQYAYFQHYPNNDAWAAATIARFRSWNVNTIGAWSDDTVERGQLPFCVELEFGGSNHVPWSDLFSPQVAESFDKLAKQECAPLSNNPGLLGYFTDNELGWWDDTLFITFLKAGADNYTHRVLVNLIKEHYHDDFSLLQRDFDTGQMLGFADLDNGAAMTLRPDQRGIELVDEFMYILAKRYYQLAHDAIRHYDKTHLILGDRYAQWYTQAVARAAKDYVDVVSINYGADWNDGHIARFFLESLHRLTGKPILISEYYFCANQNRSGNKNTSDGFPTVETQAGRAHGFATQLTKFAALPYVVGAHWFQFYDEPTKGRGDGENYDMGLVDIHDQPYTQMTAVLRSLNVNRRHAEASPLSNPLVVDVPPAVPDANVGLLGWKKQTSYAGFGTGDGNSVPFGELYASWEKDRLYVGMLAADYADDAMYPGSVVPQSERDRLTLSFAGSKPIDVWFGFKRAISSDPRVAVAARNGLKTELVLSIPADAISARSGFKSGEVLDLAAHLSSHSREHEMSWRLKLRLGEN